MGDSLEAASRRDLRVAERRGGSDLRAKAWELYLQCRGRCDEDYDYRAAWVKAREKVIEACFEDAEAFLEYAEERDFPEAPEPMKVAGEVEASASEG